MDMKSAYQMQLNKLIDLQNVFMIKPNTKDGKDLKIAIDYSPMYSEALGCMLNTIPVFNNDGEPSQHGFVLQIDQPIHLGNSIHYRAQYEKKIAEASEKNRNLLYPKPRGTKTFCNVCKEYIEDYLKHTESKAHIQKFRKNKVIKLISSLADEFQKSQSMPHNTLNLHSDADRCGYYQSTFEESLDHYDSTQQEPHTIKKVKVNEDSEKMGNYSNLACKDNYGRQCL